MDKKEVVEQTRSSRMVAYLAAAVALLAVAFIVLIACATYIIENQECDETTTSTDVARRTSPESCDEFHYEGQLGNITYAEYTTVCKGAKTEFGVVRDKTTGYVMSTFFMDYKQTVSVVYLAKSHKCLLSHDLDTDFEDDLANYQNEQYGQGPYAYSIGDEVDSWDEIPQDMRGFCSPRNTFRWLKHEPDVDEGHRSKRHGLHMCCCFFVSGGRWYVNWACGSTITSCTFGSSCLAWATGHSSTCSSASAASVCAALYNSG